MMAAHPILRRSRGFTLIELLAAITLLALLTAILMGTVRGAERSTSAATEVGERTEQYSRTQAFLREHLAGVLPMRWRREVGQPLKFAGRADSLVYLAPITSQIATGGVNWWQLTVAKSSGNPPRGQLVLRRAAPDPEEKAVPEIPAADAITLADNIESLTLAYFDPGDDPLNNPDAGAWRDSCKVTRRRRCASASGCSRTASGPSSRRQWRGRPGCSSNACALKKRERCCEG